MANPGSGAAPLTERQRTLVLCDVLAAKRAHRLAQYFIRQGDRVHAKVARDTRDINLRAARQRKDFFAGVAA